MSSEEALSAGGAGEASVPLLRRWDGVDTAELAARLEAPQLEVHASLPSTSDRVRALWTAHGRFWRFVVADEQTAGRGRRGREWRSPPGTGVWLSVAVPARDPEVDALLPIRIGMALARGLTTETNPGAVRVKWPNDLLIGTGGGRPGKVGGILCERISRTDGGETVIAGVGLNVLQAPDGASPGSEGLPPAALVAALPGLARTRALEVMVEAIRTARAHAEPTLSQGERARWSGLDALSGRRVVVEGEGQPERRGVARGVDATGRLLLEGSGGTVPVVSGSVRPE